MFNNREHSKGVSPVGDVDFSEIRGKSAIRDLSGIKMLIWTPPRLLKAGLCFSGAVNGGRN